MDARTVNVIASACTSTMNRVVVAALQFFLGELMLQKDINSLPIADKDILPTERVIKALLKLDELNALFVAFYLYN